MASIQENDINIPPAQDSPKNIVNVLDDDCLQAILRKIDDQRDFYRAAEVCTWFQDNAKICFPFKHVCLDCFFDTSTRKLSKSDNNNKLNVENCLILFGSRIKSLSVYSSKERDHMYDEILNLVVKYCGKTLKMLKIYSSNDKDHVWELASPFEALEGLELSHTSFNNFDASLMFPKLKSLFVQLTVLNVDWLVNKFPNLQHVEFSYIEKLTNDTFIEFQKSNPQLNSLSVSSCGNLTSSVWEGIGNRLPSVIELTLPRLEGNLRHFGQLKHLKKLDLHKCVDLNEIKSLFTILTINNHSVEELAICYVDIELGVMLQKLKTVKNLIIKERAQEKIIIDIVKELPLLEYLHVGFFGKISLWATDKILEHGHKLTKFETTVHMEPDLDQYKSIVARATGRVKVLLFCFYEKRQLSPMHEDILKQISKVKNDWVRLSLYGRE